MIMAAVQLSGGIVIIEIEGRDEKLSLEEAAFLLEKGKLKIKGLSIGDFFSRAISTHPAFIVRYIVYRDLKERGYAVRAGRAGFWLYPRGARQGEKPARYIVRILREKDLISIADLDRLLSSARNMRKELILAIVDEESDVTYYEIRAAKLEGTLKEEKEGEEGKEGEEEAALTGTVSLADDRVLIHDEASAERLHRDFYGKLIGEGNKQLILSLIETAYLMRENNRMVVHTPTGDMNYEQFLDYATDKERDFKDKLVVYTDLRAKGLVLKTGFKFGSHFRVYTALQQKHSSYLVHVVHPEHIFAMNELARAVRLAQGVRKRMIFAYVDEDGAKYIDIGRRRL